MLLGVGFTCPMTRPSLVRVQSAPSGVVLIVSVWDAPLTIDEQAERAKQPINSTILFIFYPCLSEIIDIHQLLFESLKSIFIGLDIVI
jgi:hypothetical protein